MALTKLNTYSLPDNAVTSAKIGTNVIVAEDLAANSVTVSEITDDAVTQAKVADQAIDEARMQISNAGTNGQFLQKQSGNTGGLTWADAAVWSTTTEGEVTTTNGQDNIDFTIPADANRIKVMFWYLGPVNQGVMQIKLGQTDGTILGSGDYLNTSWYFYENSNGRVFENTDAISMTAWTGATNLWYGSLNLESMDNEVRRWTWNWNPYNTTYGEYFAGGNGRTSLSSGQQVRKIRLCTSTSGGFDVGGFIKVLTAQV